MKGGTYEAHTSRSFGLVWRISEAMQQALGQATPVMSPNGYNG